MYTIITKVILLVSTIFLIVLVYPSISKTDEINEVYLPFLLEESDIPGYELINQGDSWFWQVGDTLKHDAMRQNWKAKDPDLSKTHEINITMYVFDTVSEGIYGTNSGKSFTAGDIPWGSFDGSIIGEHSWFASTQVGSSQCFIRGNIGVIVSQLPSESSSFLTLTIVEKIFNKIEKNLHPDILSSEQESKKKQITLSKYRQITDPVLSLGDIKEFSFLKQWDSKWVIDENSFATGIRTEWKNDSGSIVGIDICEFETKDAAQSAIEQQALYTSGKIFDMEDMTTFDAHISRWREMITSNKYYSAIGVYNNIAAHVYQYDPEKKPDTNIIKNVIYKLVDQVTFFVPSAVNEEGNTAETPQAFTLHRNAPNPFNPGTAIGYELTQPGQVSLRIYDLLGREVAAPVDGMKDAGHHEAYWNGRDSTGNPAASGVYLYRLEAGGSAESRRMMLVR